MDVSSTSSPRTTSPQHGSSINFFCLLQPLTAKNICPLSQEDTFSLSPAPSHICPASAQCLVVLFGASL
ncbi:hypothetical protein ILYODFUR_029640 [Ilyodon furcidens]|uniref:Uncharacterized protein n=1 Tax=Ilyodon furcidens TaxID=33524 RepID=A0ABV0V756_9TELE